MADRTTVHATFVLERTYEAAPARVYAAWADPASKARWFSCHPEYHMDFRVGGTEMSRGGEPGGPVYTTNIRFHDIVPGERIVYTYDVLRDDQRMSVSMATVEFAPEGGGTRMTFTDQGVYLDGLDTPEPREFGTRTGLDRLDAELRGELAGV
ncbi:MAG TPA: SRPBCC family protein [Longimicrobiaceae bacterium]|nr:SRPBCC family protein [Longimicrobiaceae bacterium]